MRYHSGINRFIVGLISLCAVLTGSLCAQNPGGVQGPVVWILAESNEVETSLRDVLQDTVLKMTDHRSLMNYNPSLYVSDSEALQVDVSGTMTASKATHFIVFATEDETPEYHLWSLTQEDTATVVMTSRRVADLQRGVHADFTEQADVSRLHSYVHYKELDKSPESQLRILGQPVPGIPVDRFRGHLAEVVVYDRVLSEIERLQVESYLAIKYGLTLRQLGTSIYLNAKGKFIWNAEECGDYVHNIAGIGRDELSGLYQKQSSSCHNSGLLAIAADQFAKDNTSNRASIEDHDFLMWSDNNAALKIQEYVKTGTPTLQRVWNMHLTGASDYATQVRLDPRYLAIEDEYETIWLQLDRGESLPELIAPSHVKANLYTYSDVMWDTDMSGSDHFTFVPGPNLIVQTIIDAPECQSAENGQLSIKANGGVAPYRLTVTGIEQNHSVHLNFEEGIQTVDLPIGVYEMRILDSEGQSYAEMMSVGHRSESLECIAETYWLPAGEKMTIDASELCLDQAAAYQWIEPSGIVTQGSGITIEEAGSYWLRSEHDGCISMKKIVVHQKPTELIDEVSIYPNPCTARSKITIRVLLSDAKHVQLDVIDSAGGMVRQKQLGMGEIFNTHIQAPEVPGVYTIRVTAGSAQSSHSLVVIR